MLKTIITREFLNNILNLRFMIGLVLCIIVTITCIMILAHDYKKEMANYNLRVNSQDEFLDNYATHAWLFWMIRQQKPPERFRPLIIGIPGKQNSEFLDYNPLPILFPPLDFLFIVTTIMSLLAILFSYDAITGERQSGTLRLVISNSISRTKILFGKLVGGVASLIIPFILSVLVGGLYISINPSIQWDGSAWAEFALLTAASITFITLFYLLGLMVSAFSRYSAISILNCLFLWVLLTLVIPNLCPYFSAQLYRIPSIKETERRDSEIEMNCFNLIRQRRRELVKKFAGNYGQLFSELESMGFGGVLGEVDPKLRKAAQQRATADPEFKAMMNAFREELEQTYASNLHIKREETKKLWKDLETKADTQTRLAKNLACISPFANFVYVARDLTGTGLRSLEYFEHTNAEYGKRFWRYADEKMEDARQKNPEFKRESFLDVSDRPRFVFKEEALKDKLNEVLPYCGILVLFNVLFFSVAFGGFMIYDVR